MWFHTIFFPKIPLSDDEEYILLRITNIMLDFFSQYGFPYVYMISTYLVGEKETMLEVFFSLITIKTETQIPPSKLKFFLFVIDLKWGTKKLF